MRNDGTTGQGGLGPASDAARAPVPGSDAARGLRVAFDLLLQDMALEPLDPATVPWNQPILVLRSAPMDRLLALLDQIVAHSAAPALHIMSHAHDEPTIRDRAPCDFTFHAYPTPGRYRLEEIPAAMLDRLRSVGFGSLIYLDPGTSADLFGDVEALFAGVNDTHLIRVGKDGAFARVRDPRLRRQAESAFLRLIEWYQLKLESGLPGESLPRAAFPHQD